jgi:ubiquinone/menaquinone biosynthesis C-methylase UbiE
MDDYLLGVYLTNFLWAHHMEISLLFEQRFLTGLAPGSHIVEIASGHGGWGLWALQNLPSARLDAFDISPSAIDMASKLAGAANLQNRVSYTLKDALLMDTAAIGPADACICSFLIEHLERPDELLDVIGRLLRPGGTAFLTGALTAAQVDHIYEFRRESELVLLAERHGLRVTDFRSVAPRRTLRGAKFLPRSAALLLQRRRHETW